MLVIKTSLELIKSIDAIKEQKQTIAFVATMGNLHKGHLNLVSLAHQRASIVIVSVFVNPLQFNQAEDLRKYPRTLENDIELCKKQNVDILFTPSVEDIYPDGEQKGRIEIPELATLSTILEGAFRPKHFSGVITVVKKFFDLVRPDVAVFGEKDFQQLLIIQKMVMLLNLPIRIISSPTIRESDGLAMSSRNSKLLPNERRLAVKLFDVVNSIREQIMSGNNNFTELSKVGLLTLSQSGFKPDYIAVRNSDDLRAALVENTTKRVILAAASLGNTRLIDNLRI